MFAAELLLVPTGLITAGFLTRQLGSAEYGRYVLALATVGWLQWTAAALLSRATNRLVSSAADWRPLAAELLRLHGLIGATAGALLLVGAPWLAEGLRQPAVGAVLRLLAVDVLLTVLGSGYRAVLVAMGELTWLSWTTALRWVARMGAVLGFVWLGWSVTGAVIGILVGTAVWLGAMVWRVGPLPLPAPEQRGAWRRGLFGVAAPTALATVLLRLFERGDLLLLSTFDAGADTLGLYGAAQNLTLVIATLGGTVAPVLLASITRQRRDGQVEAATRLERDAQRIPWLILPLAGIAVGAAPDIMQVVYGREFAAGAAPLAYLVVGGCALTSFAISSAMLIAADRAWWVAAVTAPMVGLLPLLGWLLYPAFNASGMAMASMIPALLAAAAAYRLTMRVSRARLAWRDVALCVGLTAVTTTLAASWVTAVSPLRLLKLAVLGGVAVAVLLATGQVRVRGGVRLS
jgi:O-antigen/teichoic acid export membrane protein